MANLITLAEYKVHAGISSNTQDAQLNVLLPKVSQFIKTYCNRTFIDFYDEPTTVTSDGDASYIYLKESPTVSLISVEYSSDFGKTYTPLVEFTDYVLNTTYDRVECINTGTKYRFLPAVNGYKITYTGGYEKTPDELKLAAFDLITYYIKMDMSIKSTRSAGSNTTAVEYITTAGLPSHIKRILDLYRLDLI
jgi:hypothetical protein